MRLLRAQSNSKVLEKAAVCRTCGTYPIRPNRSTITAKRAYANRQKTGSKKL